MARNGRVLTALETGGVTIFFPLIPPCGAGRCRSPIDQVHHLGDGEPSHQLAPGIHHGGGSQVVLLAAGGGLVAVLWDRR